MRPTRFLLYSSLFLLTQCSQCKDDPTPRDLASQLPPDTQTGANTFGCLVNGQPYTPQGQVGLGSNFNLSYDPTYNGGSLIVGTYRADQHTDQAFAVLGQGITRPGTYPFGVDKEANAYFRNGALPLPCRTYDSREAGSFSQGQLTITRLDLQAGIVAGTFAFTLHRPGCDTLKITQGRFDGKL